VRARGYGFVPHVAARYVRATRASGRIASSALSIAGVAAGVMTLVAVMGVMNGFQLGFIEDILEVSSYHLQLSGEQPLTDAQREAVRSVKGVEAVVAFADNQAVLDSDVADPRGCVVRAIEADALRRDRGFAEHLDWVEGGLTVDQPESIAIGSELAGVLGVGRGDKLRILSLSGSAGGVDTSWRSLTVVGVFRTGYQDYDLGMAFISFATCGELFAGGGAPVPVYGVKLDSRFSDQPAAEGVRRALGAQGVGEGYRVTSWREFNRGFFSALLFEKVLMLVVVGLIFVVVAFSIYHALERTVYERREEIALLAALGARRSAIRAVFVLQGALIGLAGGVPGLLAGLLVSANVNEVFGLVERVVNGALGALDVLLSPFVLHASGSFSIFSPADFYLDEVPSRVLFSEALGITAAGVLSAAVAALLASGRILDVAPAEVLRDE
jgi:lipoprotein-releasing system permease protein